MEPAEHTHPKCFYTEVAFICPFCGCVCSAGYTLEQGNPQAEQVPAVLHDKPACSKFEALEPDEYLHQVNIMFGAHN